MFRLFALVLAWVSWSGHYTYSFEHPLIAYFGVASIAGVWLLARRMDDSHVYGQKTTLGPSTALYLVWLLWEIVKSNLAVAKIILKRDMPLSPRIIQVRTSAFGEAAKVLYANSITLTPGTITLDMRGSYLYVHAIDRESADGVESGDMDRRVAALEKDE